MSPKQWRTLFRFVAWTIFALFLASGLMMLFPELLFSTWRWVVNDVLLLLILVSILIKFIFWIRHRCPFCGKRLNYGLFRYGFVNIDKCVRCFSDLKEWSGSKQPPLTPTGGHT